MYLEYFGLRENPFSIPPDPHYLYLSHSHQEALAHLQYGLAESGGFVQLTGEVGTGKTMLIRTLGERLPSDVDVALVLYPVLTVVEFIAAICDELRAPYPKGSVSLKMMIDALNAHLLQNHAVGRRTVLIIDEAQNLSRGVLEQIRLLTNLETTKQKLLQIILIGQPELNSLLAQQDLRQLAQRVTARYRLTALTRKETFKYITHRCRVAGAKTPLFNLAAMRQLHIMSRGIPRLINVICDRALLGAYGRGTTTVDVAIVRRAAAEVESGASRQQRRQIVSRWVLPGVALAVVMLLIGWQLPTLLDYLSVKNNATAALPKPTPAEDKIATATASENSSNPDPAPPPAITPPGVDPKKTGTLTALLANPDIVADTESALKGLFARWDMNYTTLVGATGCERALNAGLRCLYMTGTWNELRRYNRPAVIELQDTQERKFHALVAALKDDTVSLEFTGRRYNFTLKELDRHWFGKYLMLWKPSAPEVSVLQRGMRGESVLWLRDTLARSRGEPLSSEPNDLFDKELETQVMDFQHSHQLEPDGVAGERSLALLYPYNPEKSPTLLPQAGSAAAP